MSKSRISKIAVSKNLQKAWKTEDVLVDHKKVWQLDSNKKMMWYSTVHNDLNFVFI